MNTSIVWMLMLTCVQGFSLGVRVEDFQGRQAYVLENERIRVNALAVERTLTVQPGEHRIRDHADAARTEAQHRAEFLFGVPTFRRIPGRERARMPFAAFVTEIPSDYSGVEDLSTSKDVIIIRE